MTDNDEQYYSDKEAKEYYFQSPLWYQEEPKSLGSIDVIKRRMYEPSTTYGQGKIIQASLDLSQNVSECSLPLHPGTLTKDIDNLLCTHGRKHSGLSIVFDLQNLMINFTLRQVSAENYDDLLAALIDAWLLSPDNELKTLSKDLECDIDWLNDIRSGELVVSFNDGFDIETYIFF